MMSKKKPKRAAKPKESNSKPNDLSETVPFDRRAMEALMQQLAPSMFVTDSQADAAQQVMYQAFEATSPQRQMTLARKALEISPDCADAYVMLAEYAETLPDALELYEQGVAAGERALGAEGFEEYEGHFWAFLETRPYMRARAGLADSFWVVGRREEAAEHCREMLRLNPNDNQGMRYRLVAMLLDLERHDELDELLKRYEEDSSAEWAYTHALLMFRREGDSDGARVALRAATEVNQYVPEYLARVKPMPREAPDSITLGGEDEAISYAAQFLPAWKETPGAAAWLRNTLKLSPTEIPKRTQPPWSKLRLALAQLPQREHETWELDLRTAAVDNHGESSWMLVAYNATDDQVLNFDFFDNRPKDTEVWSFLMAALRAPQDGASRRPAVIRTARKTWIRSWQSKLRDIGVELHFGEPSVELDHWFETMAEQFEKAQHVANAPGLSEAEWSKIDMLPQEPGETWYAVMQQLPVFIQIAGDPKRPWVCLVVDTVHEAILATEIEMDEPSDDWLLRSVWHAMCSPAVGEARRPSTIHVATDRQREPIAEKLEPFDIQCIRKEVPEQLWHMIDGLVAHLGGPQQRKALIHSPGVTVAQVSGFFEAAADFYRARPWREIPGDSIIQVACDRFESGPWYAVVMGQSGMEQGFALYEDIELLRTLLTGRLSDEESGRRTSAISVTYGEKFDVAPEDLDETEKHGWPVAGPEAYPCVLRVNPGMALRTPLKWELELLEGCMRAIPDFLGKRVGKTEIAASVSGDIITLRLERLEE
jgi:tetratricopeptide (TPR) repeat protein